MTSIAWLTSRRTRTLQLDVVGASTEGVHVMKRNRILASAVILALGSSGTALAGIATECSSEAARLTTEVGNSAIADTAKADLTKALAEAQDADLARCEQVVGRVRRELGIAPEATDSSSGNVATSTSESTGYEAGHASASESLPEHPGAAANDSSSPSVSASGETEQGYASANETVKGDTKPTAPTTDDSSANGNAAPNSESAGYEEGHASATESLPEHPGSDANDSSAAGVSASGEVEQGDASAQETLKTKTVPARADTGANALSSMSARDLIDKPVKSSAGKDLGEIAAIVRDKSADGQGYAVISSDGKQVLVEIDQLKVAEDGSLQLPVSDPKDFAAYPEYVEENYTKYDGSIAQIL